MDTPNMELLDYTLSVIKGTLLAAAMLGGWMWWISR